MASYLFGKKSSKNSIDYKSRLEHKLYLVSIRLHLGKAYNWPVDIYRANKSKRGFIRCKTNLTSY